MNSRLKWTKEEDIFLEQLKKEDASMSWPSISEALNKRFSKQQRSPKQCRDRYTNFSKFFQGKNSDYSWTIEQINLLHKSFIEFGFKWKLISTYFKQKYHMQQKHRSQNSLKNKFYSLLRKLIRKINQSRKDKSKAKRRQLTLKSLKKVLQLARQSFVDGQSQKFDGQSNKYTIVEIITLIFDTIEEIEKQVEHKNNFFDQLYRIIFNFKRISCKSTKNQSASKGDSQEVQISIIHKREPSRSLITDKNFRISQNESYSKNGFVQFGRTLQNQKLSSLNIFQKGAECFQKIKSNGISQQDQNQQKMQFISEEHFDNFRGRGKQASLDEQICQIQNREYNPDDFYFT